MQANSYNKLKGFNVIKDYSQTNNAVKMGEKYTFSDSLHSQNKNRKLKLFCLAEYDAL